MENGEKRFDNVDKRGKTLSVELLSVLLRKNLGNMSQCARAAKVTRQAVSHYISDHPELEEIVKESRESIVDLSEDCVIKAIRKGNAKVAMDVLKTLGRKRGYIEETSITGPDGGPIEFRVIEVVRNPVKDASCPATDQPILNGTH